MQNNYYKQNNLSVSNQLVFSTYGKNCENVYSRLVKKMQLEHISIFRKSVVVNWLKEYDLRKVQYFAGHKYISSTEKYISTDIENLKKLVIKFHPF